MAPAVRARVGRGFRRSLTYTRARVRAQVEEIEDKQKELEAVVNPIFSKLYAGGGGRAGAASEDEDLTMERDEL